MDGSVQVSVFTDITVPEIVKKAGYSMEDSSRSSCEHPYFISPYRRNTAEGCKMAVRFGCHEGGRTSKRYTE